MSKTQLTNDQNSAFNRAAGLCSQTEYCSSEITEKLKRWGLLSEDINIIIEKLIIEKYIDDDRFARAYVKDKFKFNRWGRQKIIFMLQGKKIPSDIIKTACSEIEEDDYLERLEELLISKLKSIKSDNPFEKRNKLMRFAMSRGFEPELINKTLRELQLK
jgi:regulatory protein